MKLKSHVIKGQVIMSSTMSSDQLISNRLISAVSAGHLETARELISSYGLSYSKAWSDGYALLLDATFMNRTAVIELLLESGSPCNSYHYKPADTPLHFAALHSNINIIKMLLNKGADINAKNQYGKTPLFNMIDIIDYDYKQDKLEVIQLLLKHKADVNTSDNYGTSPLHIAVKKRCLKIVELLLEYAVNVNCVMYAAKWNKNYAPLHYAVQYNLKEVITLLLSRGANVDIKEEGGLTPLHIAAEKGYIHIAEELLSHGACINSLTLAEGFTPLHIAAKYEQEEIAKLLISYEADINAQDKSGKTPIFYAIESMDIKMTRLLLNNKANVKDYPELLNNAIKKECIEIVEALLQYDADINYSDKYGRTPLHFTILMENEAFIEEFNTNFNAELVLRILSQRFFTSKSHDTRVKMAKLLLSKGANVNSQTKSGITTLCAAIQKGYTKFVEALLEYNANLNSAVKTDVLPLHLSVQIRNVEIIRMLLNKGADINAKQMNGRTALHIAAALMGSQEVIKILLKYGSDVNAQDKYGRTALHLASEAGHENIVEALLKYGSDINVLTGDNKTPFDCANAKLRSQFANFENYDDDDDFDIDSKICKTLCVHVVKMKTANLYVNDRNLTAIKSTQEIKDYQVNCEKEIAKMKSEKINNANISFYDILARDTSSLANYMRNENLVQVLTSDDYKSKFPIYASMIKCSFRKVMKRKELLDQVNEIVYFLFHNLLELPYDCTDKILGYLSDEDLRIIMDAS